MKDIQATTESYDGLCLGMLVPRSKSATSLCKLVPTCISRAHANVASNTAHAGDDWSSVADQRVAPGALPSASGFSVSFPAFFFSSRGRGR